jgi:hypothetical protein
LKLSLPTQKNETIPTNYKWRFVMNRALQSMLLIMFALLLSPVSLANDIPTPVHVFCSNFFDVPDDEGFFRSGDFCYQIKVSCDGDVSGGFLWGEVNSAGDVYGHMESVAGPPGPIGPDVPSCVLHWFDHWQNDRFENSCKYKDYGVFKLKAKLVPLQRCD